MAAALDHLILKVNDAAASADFYARVLGFANEGSRGPFQVLRVSPDFVLQLAPWGTQGGEHLAFALDPASFDAVFARLRAEEPSLYFFDPNQHLLEIRRRG